MSSLKNFLFDMRIYYNFGGKYMSILNAVISMATFVGVWLKDSGYKYLFITLSVLAYTGFICLIGWIEKRSGLLAREYNQYEEESNANKKIIQLLEELKDKK